MFTLSEQENPQLPDLLIHQKKFAYFLLIRS